MIKRILLLALLLTLTWGAQADGIYLGTKAVTDNVAFPVFCFDTTSAFSVTKPDSFTVIVWHEDVGDNTVTYETSGNTTVAWIAGHESGGGTPDTTWYFRDAVADIDAGQGEGLYSGVVYAWATTKRTPTSFSFYLADTNMAGVANPDLARVTTAANKIDVTATGEVGVDLSNVNGTLDASEIGAAAIGTSEFDAASEIVSSGNVLDVTVTGEAGVDLSNVNGTLDAGEIGADAITAAKIAADAIGASEIAASAIGTEEFAAEADNIGVNFSDISGTLDASEIGTDAIGADELADDAIDSNAFALDARKLIAIRSDSGNVSGGASTLTENSNIGVDLDDVVGTLDAADIGADAITSAKIANNAIGPTEFSAETDQFGLNLDDVSGTLDASEIGADAIGASELADNAIDSSAFALDARKLIALRSDSGNASGSASTLTASDNIGINWGNISNPTTVVGLSGTTVGTVTDVTNEVAADMTKISGDATAADNFETMLDGTGGKALLLSQLRIVSDAGQPALFIHGVGDASTADDSAAGYILSDSGIGLDLTTLDATGDKAAISVVSTDGDGLRIVADDGGNKGIYVQADGTAGRGIEVSADGTAGVGLLIQGNASDLSSDIVGDITGNVNGSVGSVTGAVGSVTGNVDGNVTGSIGSLTQAAGDDAAFYVWNMKEDSADWNSGGDSSMGLHQHLSPGAGGGGSSPWDATTMDSVLQALDYTNNNNNVMRIEDTNTVWSQDSSPWNATTMDSVLQALDYTNNVNNVLRVADTNNAWSATGSTGSGVKTVVARVIDTSGTDDTLSGANLYVLNSGQTQTIASGITNGSPADASLVMDSTTSYVALTYVPGYVFPSYSFTTTDGTTPDTIAVQGYNVSVTATPSSHQTTLTGTCRNILAEGLGGAEVSITLTGATAMYSSTNSYPPGRIVVYSDAAGDWSATIIGTDSLNAYLPQGVVSTYCVEWKHPEAEFNACNLSIPANGSTTAIRDLLEP